MKIKTQAWEPDTCDAPGCRMLILWDADAAPELREHRIAGFERVCPAHETDLPEGMLLWWDGNWKPMQEYLEYQRAWFRRLNHVEWQDKRQQLDAWFAQHGGHHQQSFMLAADGKSPHNDPAVRGLVGYMDLMPDSIRSLTSDPKTTGSLLAPGQNKIDGLRRAHGWNQRDNVRKNQTIDAMQAEHGNLDRGKVAWRFEGKGESRGLVVASGGQLSAQQRNRVKAMVDIQFGANAVTVEA